MNTIQKPAYRSLSNGLSIITNKDLKNGEVLIPKGSCGKIVYHQNQVSADVWFNDPHNLEKYLKLEPFPRKNFKFRGLVFTLSGLDFSIFYIRDLHSDLMFNKEQLKDVPYLNLKNLVGYESNFFKNNERVIVYKLSDIIDEIEENFSDFVFKLETRPATEEDSSELESVFTDESIELFELEKEKILEPFSNSTGIHYNFLGGAIES